MLQRAAITTILFTDLVGSTELLQQVGDEQGQRIFMQHYKLLSDVVTTTSGQGSRFLGFRAHLGQARILRWTSASEHADAIEAALRTAETLAREIELRSWLPWVYEERAALALALGDQEKRRGHLEEARRLYEEIGASGHLERLAGSSTNR